MEPTQVSSGAEPRSIGGRWRLEFLDPGGDRVDASLRDEIPDRSNVDGRARVEDRSIAGLPRLARGFLDRVRALLLIVRRVGHALVKFALVSAALKALFLHQLAASLHHLTMAAAIAAERCIGR